MKIYSSDAIFRFSGFPLDVSYAFQRPFMIPHGHEFIELVLVTLGHTIHTIHPPEGGELSYSLIQGDVFSILPGEIHSYTSSSHLAIYNIAFAPELVGNDLAELRKLKIWETLFGGSGRGFRMKIHLSPYRRVEAERILKKIIVACSEARPGFMLKSKNAFLEFLFLLDEALPMVWETGNTSEESNLARSIAQLEKNPSGPFRLEETARAAGMSVSAYTKKFRQATGVSPLDYCIGMRLETVRRLLLETEQSVSEIAVANGFCDGTYLVKLFRQRFGITPARYRGLLRYPGKYSLAK